MKSIGSILSILLGVIAIGWHVHNYTNTPEVVYVSVPEVFNGFQMKIEMENKYKIISGRRQEILDSMKVKFNQSLVSDDVKILEKLRQEIAYKEQQFEESNMSMVEKSNQEILTQLNVYMKEFGEKHDYDVILGAQGSGSLIYAKEHKNVTHEMLEFVNEKYLGVK